MITRLLTTTSVLLAAGLPAAEAATVKFDCTLTGNGKEYCNYIKERFEKETGNTLEFVELPFASDEKLSLFQQVFAAKDGSVIDVFSVDTVWLGQLDKHLADLTDDLSDLKPQFFPAAWNNDVVNGRLKAIPRLMDAGLLYYRTDLLEKYGEKPPETWADLKRVAERIQKGEQDAGNAKMTGFVFQGKAYEGLTCDALEWVSSFGGGTFIDDNGAVTIDNPAAARAFDTAASWLGSISSKGTLGYMEEESRAVFQNGDAVFMRNWPYAYVLAQDSSSPIKGKVGIAPLPSGGADGRHSAALGGWQWGVSAYSQHKAESEQLIRILSDEAAQKKAFFLLGNSPALTALYDQPDVLAVNPIIGSLKPVFEAATPRPASPVKNQYGAVSKAIYNAAFDVLSGRATGTQAVADLQTKLKRIKGPAWK